MTDAPNPCGDPDCTGFHPPESLARLALGMLDAARSPYLRPTARVLVEQAVDQHDADHLWAMCELWAMAWLMANGLDESSSTTVSVEGISFVNVGQDGKPDASSATENIDDVPPGARFAGRFLLASVSRDTEQRMALVNSVSGDRATCVDAVGHLLLTCAHGINQADAVQLPTRRGKRRGGR